MPWLRYDETMTGFLGEFSVHYVYLARNCANLLSTVPYLELNHVKRACMRRGGIGTIQLRSATIPMDAGIIARTHGLLGRSPPRSLVGILTHEIDDAPSRLGSVHCLSLSLSHTHTHNIDRKVCL